MRVRELVSGTPATLVGPDTADVATIIIDSSKVTSGCVFVAIKGIARDGHDFLGDAAARGARVLVVEDATQVPAGFAGTVVVVPNGRAALNHLASRFFGDPGHGMFCIGVTGTDGKTTVTWMIEAVLAGSGIATGVIGTVDHHFLNHVWPGDTTPPPLALQERIAQMRALGAEAVALEATSQGLSQSRVSSVPFDVAVFTNLTRDHLDYHRTLDAYCAAKERLFTEALAGSPKAVRHAIINVDTPYGARLRVPDGVTRWTYGAAGTGADLTYHVLATGLVESEFRFEAWGQTAHLRLPMMGAFNGANALAAVAAGVAKGFDLEASVEALRSFKGVPGRAQKVVYPGERTIFIDYAHDPDAFEKLLRTAKAALLRERPGAKLVTVFGCGGDRDRGKRPLMAQAALQWSDRVVVTSDNPRSEDPSAILAEIMTGVPPEDEARVVVEVDRAKAIGLALDSSAARDVIMVLGKGHEPYQIVGDKRLPYSDAAAIQAHLEQRDAG